MNWCILRDSTETRPETVGVCSLAGDVIPDRPKIPAYGSIPKPEGLVWRFRILAGDAVLFQGAAVAETSEPFRWAEQFGATAIEYFHPGSGWREYRENLAALPMPNRRSRPEPGSSRPAIRSDSPGRNPYREVHDGWIRDN